jgi:outer membrane protein TolC
MQRSSHRSDRTNDASTDQRTPGSARFDGAARAGWKLAIAAGAVVSSMLVGCAAKAPQPFDPRLLGDNQRRGASQTPVSPMRPLPTTLESPYVVRPGQENAATPPPPNARDQISEFTALRNAVRIPLREMVQRAVINNKEIRVAGYDPAIDKSRVIEAEARFDPTLFINSTLNRNDQFGTGQNFFSAGTEQLTYAWQNEIGIRQLLPSGGQAQLSYQTNRSDFDPGFGSINPVWESQLQLQLTQPLLRDFGNDINRARIVINRNNQQITTLEFRRRVEEIIFNIEQRYWQLQQALQDVTIQEQLLERTIDTARILYNRRFQDVTRGQISQAISSIKQRSATLIQLRQRVQDLSSELKKLMGDPDLPISSATLVLPADEPVLDPVMFDKQNAIDTALLARFELGQQQLRVDSADIALRVAKNNLLPQLNLVGSIGLQGVDDSFLESIDSALEFKTISASLGVQFELPWGNRAARAIYVRAYYQREQAVESYRNQIEQTALEVDQALRAVETAWELIGQQRQNRFAAADALAAIELRELNQEALTPEFVNLKLQLQDALASAARLENEAIANYNVAIARLEQTKGTLLRYNNILLDEAAFESLAK